jgi:hypothetical protein
VGARGRVTASADPNQLALAREAAEENGLANVDLVQGRFGSDDLGHGGFDLVQCRLVLMQAHDS